RQLEEANALTQSLKKKKTSLPQLFNVITSSMKEGQQLLLIIDQFEELYSQTREIAEQEQFLEALLSLHASKLVTVLLTMRADFLGRALLYRPFADELQNANQMIGPMDRNELIEVIERPLSGTFVSFEPGLTTQILDDVGQEPGNLPLLEFALTSLWDEQVDGKLTFAAYEKIGKVEGALTEHANDAYDTFKSEEEAKRVRRLFMQLVQPVTGTVNTKRKARRSELGDELWQLTTQLADERLVVTGQDETGEQTVELAHEALISNWQRFEGWIQEDWEFRAWQERLRAGMRQWQSHENNEGFLLLGAPLTLAEDWLQQRRLDLSQLEISYIEASIEARALRQAEEEARQQHELETAQALAETEKKRAEEQVQAATSLRKRLIYVVGLLAVAAILGITAVFFGVRSSQNAKIATNKEATAVSAKATAEIDRNNAVRSEVEAADAAATAVSANATAVVDRNNAVMNEVEAANAAATAVSANATAVVDRNNAEMNEVEANRQLRISRAQVVAAFASQVLNEPSNDTELATLLALESIYLNDGIASNVLWSANDTLRQIFTQPYFNNSLHGHKNKVNSIVYSPLRKIMASGDEDGVIHLWDMEDTSSEPVALQGQVGISLLAFSPDGQILASAIGGGVSIQLWDMTNLDAEPKNLIGHFGQVNSIAFSPINNRILASGGVDQTIRIWDLGNLEKQPWILQGHEASVNSIAFSPDGKLIASGSGELALDGPDNTVRLWDLNNESAEPIIIQEEEYRINSVAFSPDGQTLATSHLSNIDIWNINDLNNIQLQDELWGHDGGEVDFMIFSSDGQMLGSVGAFSVHVWDATTNDYFSQVELKGPKEYGLNSFAFLSDGETLAYAGQSSIIRLVNLAPPPAEPIDIFVNPQGVGEMTFFPNGEILAAEYGSGVIRLWDLINPNNEPRKLDVNRPSTLELSPDGLFLAAGSWDGSINFWDMNNLDVQPLDFRAHDDGITSISFSPNKQILASSSDQHIRFWNMDNHDEPLDELFQDDVVESITYSPDGKIFVSADRGGKIYLWNIDNLDERPKILQGHEGSIQDVVFSPDGKTLASGSRDTFIRLWNMENLDSEPIILRGHEDDVWALDYSPNGNLLASASEDGTVRLWNMNNPTDVAMVLRDTKGYQKSEVIFSPDGLTLASNSSSSIQLWILLDELMEIGCQMVKRNLSWEEWKVYVGEYVPYHQTCENLPVHPSVLVEISQ
ncbi:MAG: hypothetical protein DWQ04_08710, partial [Chloroflexi bacterium]